MVDTISVLPTLSNGGFVKDPNNKLQLVIIYFFASDDSQSVIYKGNISSAKTILEENTGNITKAASDLKSTLTALLGNYFSTVTVETTISGMIINFDVECVDGNGYTVTLSSAVNTIDGVYKTYTDLVNKYIHI